MTQPLDAPLSWGGFIQAEQANGSPLNGKVEWFGGFTPVEPKFVDRPLIQARTFHLMVGRPEVGKSALCARWIARCTNGDMYGEPRNALWLASEEDAEVDLRPRLDVAGANVDAVARIPNEFQLPRDVDWLAHYATEVIGNVGLIVLDPISNHMGGSNSNAEEEVRGVLQPLAELASRIEIPILGIRHVSIKEASGGFLARILGSTAWVGVPRVVIGIGKDDEGYVHVRTVKGNRVRAEEAGLRFSLEGAPYLDWQETVVKAVAAGESTVDIDTLLGKGAQDRGVKPRAVLAEIVRVLRERGGECESDVLVSEVAVRTGVSAKTVRNQRARLKDWGWLRVFPADEFAEVREWRVSLTNATPYDRDLEEAIEIAIDPEGSLARARAGGRADARARGGAGARALKPLLQEEESSHTRAPARDLALFSANLTDDEQQCHDESPQRHDNPPSEPSTANGEVVDPAALDAMPDWERRWHERRNG